MECMDSIPLLHSINLRRVNLKNGRKKGYDGEMKM